MTDATIELKVIQLALLIFALIGFILFSIRSGYWLYRRWQASLATDAAAHGSQTPKISSLLNNLLGLLICSLLLFFFGNSA